jgi:hypothetical protein
MKRRPGRTAGGGDSGGLALANPVSSHLLRRALACVILALGGFLLINYFLGKSITLALLVRWLFGPQTHSAEYEHSVMSAKALLLCAGGLFPTEVVIHDAEVTRQ